MQEMCFSKRLRFHLVMLILPLLCLTEEDLSREDRWMTIYTVPWQSNSLFKKELFIFLNVTSAKRGNKVQTVTGFLFYKHEACGKTIMHNRLMSAGHNNKQVCVSRGVGWGRSFPPNIDHPSELNGPRHDQTVSHVRP